MNHDGTPSGGASALVAPPRAAQQQAGAGATPSPIYFAAKTPADAIAWIYANIDLLAQANRTVTIAHGIGSIEHDLSSRACSECGAPISVELYRLKVGGGFFFCAGKWGTQRVCTIKKDANLFSAWLAVKNTHAKLKLEARRKSKSKQLQNRVTVQALTIGAFAADAGVDGPVRACRRSRSAASRS